MNYILLFLVGFSGFVRHVELSVTLRNQYLDSDSPRLYDKCSPKFINRFQSCDSTQICGTSGVTYPLDSCRMRSLGRNPFIDNDTLVGYDSVFRFYRQDDPSFRVGTFSDVITNGVFKDTVVLTTDYFSGSGVNVHNWFFELHPFYFSDLKMYVSATSAIESYTSNICAHSPPILDSDDCGSRDKANMFCPIYVRLFHQDMCDKCYKATFGVKGKRTNHFAIAGVVEKNVKIQAQSFRMPRGNYYNISNAVAKGIVSEFCASACSHDGQVYCGRSVDPECTAVLSSASNYVEAVHDHMYLREIDCGTFQDVGFTICEKKALRGGPGAYKSSKVRFNPMNGKPMCDCAAGAYWDHKPQKCIEVCAWIRCDGPFEVEGSCIGFNQKGNYICSCTRGYSWDFKNKQCAKVADVTKVCTATCTDTNSHCAASPTDSSTMECVCNHRYSKLSPIGDCVELPDLR